MTTTTHFAIRDKRDGRLIGLDDNSGGYPWKPSHPQHVKLWDTKKAAIDYCEVMGWRRPSDSYGALSWEIVEIEPLVVGSVHIDFPQYDAIRKGPFQP